MFRLVPGKYEMEDAARGYAWRDAGGVTYESARTAILVLEKSVLGNGRQFQYDWDVRPQPDEPEPWCDHEVFRLFSTAMGTPKYAVEVEDWAITAEREAVILIALEAVLAWRSLRQKVERADGYNRATFLGVQYRLSDFGPYSNLQSST